MPSHRARSLLTSSLVLGLGVAVAPSSPASAATVQCGDVLTTSTVLATDLICGPDSDGLVIGADGVRLSLGGHTISGPGAYATSYAGVRVAGHTGVRIEKGSIAGFQAGVVLDESTSAVLTRLKVRDDDQGINVAGGSGHVIERNLVSGNGRDGIRLGLSAHNRVSNNAVTGNVFGISVADGSSYNVVVGNALSRNGDFAIALFSGASQNVVQQNAVAGSASYGIQVGEDTSDSSLLRNHVTRSGSDGIHVDSPLTTVTRNDSRRNGALGIDAPGAVDGGGNSAKGNGDPAQCVGVVCS